MPEDEPTETPILDGAIYDDLRRRIVAADCSVGVIGLGYVGLPLAHALVGGGASVLGFDIDPAKIDQLDRGESYLDHLGQSLFDELAADDRFSATVDFGRLGEPDVLIVCVPTPLGGHQEPDLGFVIGAATDIGTTLRSGQLVILESTTYPGTTRDEMLPAMLAAADDESLVVGESVFVAYSPEREDPGRSSHSTVTIPKLVGGVDERSTELAVAVYGLAVDKVVPVESCEIAEAAKLLENVFRAVNIALANEMKVIFDALDIDVWKVIDAAATKPFGFMPFYPGPGLGGHCIPIDPFYLTWKAKEVGRATQFIELAGYVNTDMPAYVVDRLALALNERGKPVHGSKILVVGLAYKPDVGDTRESPSFELIDLLQERGGLVDYHDPFLERTVPTRRFDLEMVSVPIDAATVAGYDAVLIATNHSSVDLDCLADHAQLIVDTRNAMAAHEARLGDRLVKS